MSRALAEYEYMSLDDFEEALADKPRSERWELIGGRVVKLMVGARWEHGLVVQNIARILGNELERAGRDCSVFAEAFYVKEKIQQAQLLPDVMVVCGRIEPGATSTDSPVVLFEVMSIGSEARDRLGKWDAYQRIPSLRHYVLVARDRAHVEVFSRVGTSWEELRVLDGPDAILELPAIDVSISLATIYRRVLPDLPYG